MSRETTNPCEDVAERVALGEPLGELAGHAAGCGECRSLTAVADKLGAAHREIDPGLGFSARMTIGAQQRLAVRRRRRVAGSMAAVTMAGALGVFVVTRSPKEPLDARIDQAGFEQRKPLVDVPGPPEQITDEDVRFLVEVADTRRRNRPSAAWGRIEKPLRPYMKLVRNTHEEPDVDPAPHDSEDNTP
jgi:hypothetical protein